MFSYGWINFQYLSFIFFCVFQLNDLFTNTKQELEDTTRDLELTTENLKVTETKLSRATKERDEQTQLVNVHIKSEAQLYARATKVKPTQCFNCSFVLYIYGFPEMYGWSAGQSLARFKKK